MSDKRDRVSTQAVGKDLKPYARPTLMKERALSSVTAQKAPSGIQDAT